MPESIRSKPINSSRRADRSNSIIAKFKPRTMGLFILLIIILSFSAGYIRSEPVLTLTGAVFLTVWGYCLILTLVLALIHSRRAGRVSIRIIPLEISIGDAVQIIYSDEKETSPNKTLYQIPGILVRFRLLLRTKDNRGIIFDFKPGVLVQDIFIVKKRGAYFSDFDEFAIQDILGFFRFTYCIPQGAGCRLIAGPDASDSQIEVKARAGESNPLEEITLERTDNLIEHRPYVPGDDPRRINWKLYSHGGELFVREGERKPPPHSNILIIIDTQYDPEIFSLKTARQAVDMLCKTALASALLYAENGFNIQIGSTGKSEKSGITTNARELAYALAWPAAIPLASCHAAQAWHAAQARHAAQALAEYPAAADDRGIIIFAMPRASSISSALDRFIQNHAGHSMRRSNAAAVELVFLYSNEKDRPAAATCAALYNQRAGIRARAAGLQ